MATNEEIVWAVTDITDRAGRIGLYRDYFNGEHYTPWATPKWNEEFASLFKKFRDNLCPAVINAKADRIQLTSIDGGNDAVNRAITEIWTREKLEARQGEIVKNALKDGDAFVLIWPDEIGQARWYIQRGDTIAARYADEPQGELEIAAKLWPVNPHKPKSTWRLNLYYRDRIERYVTEKEYEANAVTKKLDDWLDYTPQPVDGDSEVGGSSVIPNDYGIVPVFPIPNNADTGAYGVSDLKDVIPLQDALNKSVMNMIIAGEYVSWPQRVLIGLDIDVDEEGNPTGREQKQALDRILAIANPNAKVAEWAGADLKGFIAEQDSFRAEMARIAQVPLHYLLMNGDFPSGEALDAAEAPLISQVDDKILGMKPVLQAAMSFSLQIEGTVHDPAAINPVFKPTKRVSASQLAAELTLKKELGVPDEQLWEEMGYAAEQIKKFSELKAERQATMQAAFDAGTDETVNPEATIGTPAGAIIGG